MRITNGQLTYVMLLQSSINIWQVDGHQVPQYSLISLHQQHNIINHRGSCSHLCASVTEQYNLVPAKGGG